MRWFKHLSGSWDDEKLSRLVDLHGLAGYGFWWRLLEIIALQMNESGRSACVFSPQKWGKHFGLYPKVFRKFCKTLQELDLIQWRESDGLIEINIPNLLKFRDEWTKRKQRDARVARQALRCKETDTEKEEASPHYPPFSFSIETVEDNARTDPVSDGDDAASQTAFFNRVAAHLLGKTALTDGHQRGLPDSPDENSPTATRLTASVCPGSKSGGAFILVDDGVRRDTVIDLEQWK